MVRKAEYVSRFPVINRVFRGATPALRDVVARNILDHGPEDVDARFQITPPDFSQLPTNSSDDDIKNWALLWILKDRSKDFSILEGTTVESKKFYETLNRQYSIVKDYAITRWGLGAFLTPALKNAHFASAKDLVHFARQTIELSRVAGKEGEAIMYCALCNLLYASFESERKEVRDLIRSADVLEHQMSHGISNVKDELLVPPLFSYADMKEQSTVRSISLNLPHHIAQSAPLTKGVLFEMRGKSYESALTKNLQPRGNAEHFIADGIGMRLTCDPKDVASVAETALLWLSAYRSVKNVVIENQGMYPPGSSECSQLAERINTKNGFRKSPVRFVEELGLNVESAGRFKALKILGTFGNNDNQRFEIQIVTHFNQNNKGAGHHAIFEAARDISNMSRLLDVCPESSFQYICTRAAKEMATNDTMIPALVERVRHDLLEGEKSRVIKINPEHQTVEKRYISRATYKRWKELQWITEEVFDSLTKQTRAKRQQRRKKASS